ncbi:MAG TPA: hypothetical protein DEP35_13755 [Deltaproteobacteria bacterium]|nr:hypothetical protein [Deltaproteobacteria bacterium]
MPVGGAGSIRQGSILDFTSDPHGVSDFHGWRFLADGVPSRSELPRSAAFAGRAAVEITDSRRGAARRFLLVSLPPER